MPVNSQNSAGDIRITANGTVYLVSSPKTVSGFIEELGKTPRRCVVEINGAARKYSAFKDVLLSDGDSLEILSVVAGG